MCSSRFYELRYYIHIYKYLIFNTIRLTKQYVKFDRIHVPLLFSTAMQINLILRRCEFKRRKIYTQVYHHILNCHRILIILLKGHVTLFQYSIDNTNRYVIYIATIDLADIYFQSLCR